MKLKDVCEINMGQSPESEYYNDKAQGLPFFQGNADFGELYPSVRIWCSEPKKIAQVGDILMSVRAPIGAMNIANVVCCIGRGLASIKVRDIAFLKYIWYALKSKVEELQSKGTGSTFKAINKAVLEELEISVPSIEEQKRIADELDKVSGLIEKRQKQLEKLDLLIKSRFVEMFDVNNASKLEWSQVFDVKTGSLDANAMDPNGKYPFFTCAKEIYKINNYAFDQKALLLAGNNAVGKYDVKYYEGKFNAYQRTYVLTLKNDEWSYDCFKFQLQEKLDYLQQRSKGSNTKYLTIKILSELHFIVPPIELQNQFADFVKKVEQNKSKIKNSLDKLITLKKALMQKYFG